MDTDNADRIATLEAENAKLHARIVELEVQDFSRQARMTELEKALQDAIENPKTQIVIHGTDTPP